MHGRLSQRPRSDSRAVVLRGSPKRLAPQDDGRGMPPCLSIVIASAAKQSRTPSADAFLDCFAAPAMTAGHTFASSRRISPELCFRPAPSLNRGRREDRVPAGHPRSAVLRMREEQMHSGIQVRPDNRPSLRSGFTAYVVLSPGSDALLPPSPCERSQDLTHRPRASGPHDFAVRETAPVVHEAIARATQPASTATHPAFRDDRDTPL